LDALEDGKISLVFYFDYNSKSMSPQGSLGSWLEQIYEIRLEKKQPHKAISVETK
jgi:hypothetical protein